MIPVDEALDRILGLVGPLESETVPLAAATGRVLAKDIVAERGQPPRDVSSMDGYAVRDQDAAPGARCNIVGESRAGTAFAGSVGPGQAARIFTGAPVPKGAERIVIQEDVVRTGNRIEILPEFDRDRHIRPAGGDFQRGDRIAAPALLTPARLALAAAMNAATVEVARRPEIALIPNGDELVVPGRPLPEDRIVASNIFGLRAMLESAGVTVRSLPIARDTLGSIKAAFQFAEGADMIVTTGGASVGEHDLVKDAAAELGMRVELYKVAMRPGKPLSAGVLAGTPVIGLPGNPVSSLVCGHVFLIPAVLAMLGLCSGPLPRSRAMLLNPLERNGGREHYMRAERTWDGGQCRLNVFSRQDSSLLSVFARADALVVRKPGDRPRAAGEWVEFLPLDSPLTQIMNNARTNISRDIAVSAAANRSD